MKSWFLHYLGDFVSVLIGILTVSMISMVLCFVSAHIDQEGGIEEIEEIEEIELGNYASFVSMVNDRNS
jgi:hypothetical protein